jgi:phosphatidylserine/phosphatidylglycerophosphate/cardiolipin synthase-like enzyme
MEFQGDIKLLFRIFGALILIISAIAIFLLSMVLSIQENSLITFFLLFSLGLYFLFMGISLIYEKEKAIQVYPKLESFFRLNIPQKFLFWFALFLGWIGLVLLLTPSQNGEGILGYLILATLSYFIISGLIKDQLVINKSYNHSKSLKENFTLKGEPLIFKQSKYLPWYCEYCRKEFRTKEEAEEHELSCTKKVSKFLKENFTLKKEAFVSKHDKLLSWYCEYCDRKFETKEKAKKHEVECKRLSDKKLLLCPMCNKKEKFLYMTSRYPKPICYSCKQKSIRGWAQKNKTSQKEINSEIEAKIIPTESKKQYLQQDIIKKELLTTKQDRFLPWYCEYCDKRFDTKKKAEEHEIACKKLNHKENFDFYKDSQGSMNLDNSEEENLSVEINLKKRKVKTPAELNKFYKEINSARTISLEDPAENIFCSDFSIKEFQGFIANTQKTLDISTNVISNKTLIELLNPLRNKGVRIRILTARNKEKEYSIEKSLKDSNLSIKIDKYPLNHSKFMIRDGEKLLMGSANLDEPSMERYFETNVLTNEKRAVDRAKEIFESIILQRDLRKTNNSNFLFSGSSLFDLPKCLDPLIKNEGKKVTIVCALSLFNLSVLKYLLKLNRNIKFHIILGGNWSKGASHPVDKRTIEFLNSGVYKQIENLEIEFKKEQIHSKVYIFEEQNKILVSSMNLTPSSFGKLKESGIILQDTIQIKKFMEKIRSLTTKEYQKEQYELILKKMQTPEEEKVDSPITLKTPWKTAWEDNEWAFSSSYRNSKEMAMIPKENKEKVRKLVAPPKEEEFLPDSFGGRPQKRELDDEEKAMREWKEKQMKSASKTGFRFSRWGR